ncbi:hypothetical protein [Crateriforma conspicua]|uniref:Uncharacterized protein n=1 Tax=Crateriforma conspicua TaxID=2527996 RepID=A0A5C5Y432_9PLAN|nr:hypothetical protein [Crateriforma conspicua]TWT70010.1 hypothetical protein Pan14r_23070 [Crateriforma conspicua]
MSKSESKQKVDRNTIALLPIERHDGTPVRVGRTMRRVERGTLVQLAAEGNRLTLYIMDEAALENPPEDRLERS